MLSWLRKANDFLEQVPEGILAYFDAIVDMGETIAQDKVDSICRYAAWKANISIERARQKILKGAYNQNKAAKAVVDLMNIGKKFMQDPLGTVFSFFDPILKPFVGVAKFTIELIQEISRLAENLAKIADALPPAPPNPRINFNAFQLNLGVISMGALASVDSLPDPEIIFPEPEKPWTKKSFEASFAKGKGKVTESERIKNVKENVNSVFKKG